MVHVRNELANFLIDIDDEDCPDFSLHLAAYQGNNESLSKLLEEVRDNDDRINQRIRPFLSSPLRLASTAGNVESVILLLQHGASIDLVDVKAQTPLYVALINQHWDCARILLESGANPNGNIKNLCTPLSIMAQRGYYKGVRLLCEYGADTEDLNRMQSGMSGLPLAIAATYHHFKCFATLLFFGAKQGLTGWSKEGNSNHYVSTQCSVPHAMLKYKCPPEFVYLFREFGGNFWLRDSEEKLATEIEIAGDVRSSPSFQTMKTLQGQPLSLQSCCRVSLVKEFGFGNLAKYCDSAPGDRLLARKLKDFLLFQELYLSASQFLISGHLTAMQRISSTAKEILEDGELRRKVFDIGNVNRDDRKKRISGVENESCLRKTDCPGISAIFSPVVRPPSPPPPPPLPPIGFRRN